MVPAQRLKVAADGVPFAGSNSYGIANFFDRSALFLDQLRIDPIERGIAMTAQSGMISCNAMYADNVTTGMIVNYFDIKDDIIATALRLAFVNIRRKIAERASQEDLSDLADILEPAIPAGQSDRQNIAVWIGFWGRLSADPEMRKLNDGLHQEGLATYAAAIRAA
ncbi:TetR family transcriptional regulator C-terminal domain-containing protein [Roseobacter sp.]|uniref:TetR family transcriptional regulator C-terminal domain-containing protein n=1 Tax=Roseobacter sp. TaxID=1907202 RepID=UPI00385D6910